MVSLKHPATISLAFVSRRRNANDPRHCRHRFSRNTKLPIYAEPNTKITSGRSLHQDNDGNCIYGQKSYWDSMYNNELPQQQRSASAYSWYCGYNELAPFWAALVPNKTSHVLIAGIGNDVAPIEMYDAGWRHMTAFDYSEAGVARSKALFGAQRNATLLTADATDLHMIPDGSIDATLDKGTFDALYITGKDVLLGAIWELGRVTVQNGVVMCISRVIEAEELTGAFDAEIWEIVHDGTLAFAPDGGTTIDLGAELFSWRRK